MAIKKVYELAVDLKRTSVRVNIPVLVQGDSAEFRIRLLDNGAELSTEQLTGITKVSMQSGYDAQTVIQTVGELQGSVAVFRLQKGELFRSGTVQAMVQLEDTEDRISTLRFQYQVIPDLAGNYIPGEQDVTIFQRYMNEAQAKIDEMAATDVAQLTAQLAETGEDIKNTVAPYKYDGAVFTFVDDDATEAFLTVFKPVADSLNFKFTLGAIANAADGASAYYMRKSSLHMLQNEGHEIASHTKSHDARIYRDDLATDAEIDEEFRYSQQWLKDNGFKGYDTLIFPWGEYANRLKFKRIARKYYKNALNSRGNHITKFPFDNMFITRVPLTLANDITYYQGLIDDCIAKKGWMIFCTHAGFPDEINATLLQQTAEYIQSKNMPIMTFGEAEKLKGNAMSAGEFTDANNGFYVSKQGGTKIPLTDTAYRVVTGFIGNNGSNLTMNSAISLYEKNKTTTTYLAAAQDTLTSLGGTLLTYRGGDDYLAHQTYHPSQQAKFYRRAWIQGNLSWSAWEEYVPKSSYPIVIIEPLVTATSTIKMDDPITAYAEFKETTIQFQGAADTYLGTGGIMKVFRGTSYFRYAEYRPVGTNQIHIRWWNEGTQTWGAWSKANSA